MAPTLQTIRKRSKFLFVRDNGILIKGKYLNIQFLEDESLDEFIAVGYTATKRIGNAIKRKKAKRLMREVARKVLRKYGKINSYYVLIAKNSIFSVPFAELEIELKELIS